MKCLYVTSDRFGQEGGGSKVVTNERNFLQSIGELDIINPEPSSVPFATDVVALAEYKKKRKKYDLAHFYSGTYSTLIKQLKEDGTKVSYTAAAHSIEISKQEHEKLGFTYDYPHLTNPDQWARYLEGYKLADVLIVPSSHSKHVMEGFGCTNRIVVIPHGNPFYKPPGPLPKRFTVGYLGAVGPDKGLFYLFQAWKLLNYKDVYLNLAGRDTPSLLPMVRTYGGGAINLQGFVKDVDAFYDSCTVYVQYSSSEGFGIEILEAMCHKRAVITSTNNGGPDLIENGVSGTIIPPMDYKALADAIDYYKNNPEIVASHGLQAKKRALNFSWQKMGEKYKEVWRELCSAV